MSVICVFRLFGLKCGLSLEVWVLLLVVLLILWLIVRGVLLPEVLGVLLLILLFFIVNLLSERLVNVVAPLVVPLTFISEINVIYTVNIRYLTWVVLLLESLLARLLCSLCCVLIVGGLRGSFRWVRSFLSLEILIGFVDLDGYAGVSLRAMFLNLFVLCHSFLFFKH